MADKWEKYLDWINAISVDGYPRTGGKWNKSGRFYVHPIICHRVDYVNDLKENGIIFTAMYVWVEPRMNNVVFQDLRISASILE